MGSSLSFLTAWLQERVRYLLMWPANLVRDFPIRIVRLLQTFKRAILGTLFFTAELSDAVRHDETRQWLRYKIGRIIDWLHHLLTEIFDLVGGPEIAQFFLHFLTITTPLTDNEVQIMSAIAGPEAIRYRNVRVAKGGILDLVFRFNGNLAFATWHTVNMPREGRHTRKNLAVLAHELTHVYQYEQVGSRYLGEAIYMLVKTKRDCYDYGGSEGLDYACACGKAYCDFNREQQAMIVQDYYELDSLGIDVSSYQTYIRELREGRF